MQKVKMFSKKIMLLLALILTLSFLIGVNGVYASPTKDVIDELPSTFDMRDEMTLQSVNQGRYSLCWDFACARSVETFLHRNFSYDLDISEAWISLAYMKYMTDDNFEKVFDGDVFNDALLTGSSQSLPYSYGNMGGSFYFKNALNAYGLAYEKDVPYSIGNTITNENYQEQFNLYKQYAIKSIVSDLNFDVCINYDEDFNNPAIVANDPYMEVVNNIKHYVLNYGSVYTQVVFSPQYDANLDYKYILDLDENANFNVNHALSIIGFDDNVAVQKNGVTYTGAFIAMNSYGSNDEFVYIMYDDMAVVYTSCYITNIKYNGLEMKLQAVVGNRVVPTPPEYAHEVVKTTKIIALALAVLIVGFTVPTVWVKVASAKEQKVVWNRRLKSYEVHKTNLQKEQIDIENKRAEILEKIKARQEKRKQKLLDKDEDSAI